MKYTMSKDGKERTNIIIKLRLDKEDVKYYLKCISEMEGRKATIDDLKKMLESGLYDKLTHMTEDADILKELREDKEVNKKNGKTNKM